VADTANNRIQVFSSNGTFFREWGQFGTDNGFFNQPRGIAVDQGGNVYVADTGNNRIQVFSSNGTFISKWGSQGTGDRQFSNPLRIAIDSFNNVYVVDSGNNRIEKFSAVGQFNTKWGSNGTGVGQFANPADITVDFSGNVYVLDRGNNRIQVWAPQGGFNQPRGGNITTGAEGNQSTVAPPPPPLAPEAPATSVSIVPGSATLTTDAFSPNPIQVSVGTTVTWTNDDTQPHTVTSGQNGQPNGRFDSSPNFNNPGIPLDLKQKVLPGRTFSHTFELAGDYPYFCLLHPNMVGTVRVW
jgi:plastocyanin